MPRQAPARGRRRSSLQVVAPRVASLRHGRRHLARHRTAARASCAQPLDTGGGPRTARSLACLLADCVGPLQAVCHCLCNRLQEAQEKQHQVVTHTVVAKVAQLPDGSTALAIMSDSCAPGGQGPLFDGGGSERTLHGRPCSVEGAGGIRAGAARAATSNDPMASLECMRLDGDSPV